MRFACPCYCALFGRKNMLIENVQKFIVFLLYGSLVAQAFIVLANPARVNRKANLFFGFFLFFWSSYWLLNVVSLCGLPVTNLLVIVVNSLQILTPVFLYFSILLFINPNYRFKKTDLLCFITPVLYILLLLNFRGDKQYYSIMMFINILHNLPYIAIAYFKIRDHQKRIQTISANVENINLQWLVRVLFLLFLVIVVTVCYEFYNAVIYKMHQHVVMDLLFLCIAYTTSYYVLQQKEIYPKNEGQRKDLLAVESDTQVQSEKKKLIPDSEFAGCRDRLVQLMEKQKPYLDGELNLLGLAAMMNLNVHQLSYLINKGFDENFFHFVNRYRVAYAKNLLCKTESSRFSLLGIAYESGFNSKTAFNTTFKKMTEMTPSEFQKKHSGL